MKQIPLSRGRIALVDDADYSDVLRYRWFAICPSTKSYAHAKISGSWTYMHRFIMGAARGQIIDHRNGDGLDNRRENLRFCSHGQNLSNSPGRLKHRRVPFKGIVFHRQIKRWRARIRVGGRQLSLGCYSTPEEAALAYDVAAQRLHGEFAWVNFPDLERRRRLPQEIMARLMGAPEGGVQ